MILAIIIKQCLILLILNRRIVLSNQNETLLTKEEFTKCVNVFGFGRFPNNTYELFVEKVSQIGGIDSKLEALMAVTQLSWESGGFTATASWACSQAYDKKEYWPPEGCDSYDKKDCPKNKTYYGRGYAQIKHCYNYRLASLQLYGDESLVNKPEIMAENISVAMETAIWFWKSKVHNISGVQSGHFGATTKAIVSGECDDSNNRTDIAQKRYQRFTDCLKVCNYTDNDYSEIGCYPILEQISYEFSISLIVICVIVLVIITICGVIALRYYFERITKKRMKKLVEEEQYDTVGKVELNSYEPYMYVDGQYDHIIIDESSNHFQEVKL